MAKKPKKKPLSKLSNPANVASGVKSTNSKGMPSPKMKNIPPLPNQYASKIAAHNPPPKHGVSQSNKVEC